MIDYKKKYLKYKKKYLNLRGGSNPYMQQMPQFDMSQMQQMQQMPQFDMSQMQQMPQFDMSQMQQMPQSPQFNISQNPYGMSYNPIMDSRLNHIPPKNLCSKQSKGLEIKEPKSQGLEIKEPKSQGLEELEKNKSRNKDLQRMLNNCKQETDKLKLLATANNWDVSKNTKKIPFISSSENHLFPPSGPFVYNKKVKQIEDEITEYKNHPNIYSNYKTDNGKDLDYSTNPQTPNTKTVLRKNMIAFLNSRGGRLFFGITDSLVVTGIKNVNTTEHIDHLQQKILIDVYQQIRAYNISTKRETLPDLNNIAFIWHHVYNYEEPKNIYVLEIQILPGSSNFVYKSPSDIWFRQAGTTKNVGLEEAITILQQRKESMDENQIHCCPPLQMDSE